MHTRAEGFWARRARTSVDVLGPGVLVGRVAGFWGVQAKEDSIRTRYFTCYAICYINLACYANGYVNR